MFPLLCTKCGKLVLLKRGTLQSCKCGQEYESVRRDRMWKFKKVLKEARALKTC
jgi:hypothetical protein